MKEGLLLDQQEINLVLMPPKWLQLLLQLLEETQHS